MKITITLFVDVDTDATDEQITEEVAALIPGAVIMPDDGALIILRHEIELAIEDPG